MDAAHGAGLARAHGAHASQCHIRGHCDVAAVRAADAPAAPHRLRGRSFRSPQAAVLHSGGNGHAGVMPRAAHRDRPRAAMAGLRVRGLARLRHRVRFAGASDLCLRSGGGSRSVECGRAELHLVQRGAHDRPCRRGASDRFGGHRLGVSDQRALVRRRAWFTAHAAPQRTEAETARDTLAWQFRGRLQVCVDASRSEGRTVDAVPDRHLR